MALLFIEKVRGTKDQVTAFEDKVKSIARKYAINPNWLMGVMNSETGGTFLPAIQNLAGSGATGLIQFMPSTALALGTSVEKLAVMTAVEQLDYVEKYIHYTLTKVLKTDKIRDYDDLYLMVFYPAAVGKPDSYVFPSSIYQQNKGVDMDNDGQITVSDFKAFIRRKIPVFYRLEFTSRFRFFSLRYMIFAAIAISIVVGAVVVAKKY